jgi:hypothetical protein
LPKRFNRTLHDCYTKLINPETGATITGEGGDDIGRGGRASIYFIDEAASLQHPELIEASLSQTSRCRIYVSTPRGMGNPFARKRFGGTVKVFTFHWKDDPRKDETWYEAEKKRLGDPTIVAQELDIDYSASVEGIMIPAAWVRAAIDLDLPPSGNMVAGLDVSEEGDNKTVWTPRCGPRVYMPIAWQGANTTTTAFRSIEECTKHGVVAMFFDRVGVGAGVRGTLASMAREKVAWFPINVGEDPTDTYWQDRQRTSKEIFVNLRAELWGLLRARFEKTYEYVELGIAHNPEDMISIPNCPQLIVELSLPKKLHTETGKIALESKKAMKTRGVKSPDYADSLALAFMPMITDIKIGTPATRAQRDDTYNTQRRGTIAKAPKGVFHSR